MAIGRKMSTGPLAFSATPDLAPPKTAASPTTSSLAKISVFSNDREPQSSSLRASSDRSRSLASPLIAAITRVPLWLTVPTIPKPAASLVPATKPSASMPMASSGLRFLCVILFQVNSGWP
ncbi:hypothetical protein AJ88_03480 [Mesorhizobium amorphae CCBAU 01583]|nr:hypothetical protein AJ88_03480 [Mesorhizobium amorphae CCBAU 01583]